MSIAGGPGVVECPQSTLEAITEQETEIPLAAVVTAWTFGGCKNGAEEVEVKTIKKGTLDIEIIDLPNWTHNGTLTFAETEVTVLFKKLNLDCIYAPATPAPSQVARWRQSTSKATGRGLQAACSAPRT